jgi:osmotically inducible protein OsmC
MARRIAHAEWTGDLIKGRGAVSVAGERLRLAYTPAWLQGGAGTNPEDLLAAAHAASFAMALQAAFSRARHRAGAIRVRAALHLDHRDGRWAITRSDLEGEIALEEDPRMRDIFQPELQEIIADAAANCPVSRALAGVEVTVDAGPVGLGGTAGPASHEPRPEPHGEAARRDGRERRALEGELIGRMRARARRGHTPAPLPAPSGKAVANAAEFAHSDA